MSYQQTQEWNEYNRWNRVNRRMNLVWVDQIRAYLCDYARSNPQATVLDYGCGQFDASEVLVGKIKRVDGLDLQTEAIRLAQKRLGDVNCQFFTDPSQVGEQAYDLIFANSVVQYFKDEGELEKFLGLCRRWLRPGTGQILLSDLLPPEYSATKDAIDYLFFALKKRVLFPMLVHLFKASMKPNDLELARFSKETVQSLAEKQGFSQFELLPQNLTPSRRRYTCRIKF